MRDSLESVFERWRSEKGILPDGEFGEGLLGNPYAGKPLAECPPYACMGERWADYPSLLAKLRAEHYPPLLELEAEADHLCNPPPTLPDHIPRLPTDATKPGMQRILAALILSEAAAGNIDSATKAHWELSHIQAENERRVSKTMLEGQKVIHEFALTGIKFRKGRKVNSAGPIRKAIARELKKNPYLKPRHLWEILASKPPKGWDFEGEGREARIWITGREPMGYARFSEVCKEESDKLAP
ncbi:MAG: hypothetical protein U0938_11985 [Thiobacillus sp.]|nr:hypothetical protein [Thiobacillus sp.]